MSLTAVPKLTDLLEDPAKVSLLPAEAIPAVRGELAGKVARLDTLLLARLLSGSNGQAKGQRSGDRLLNAKETAARMGVSLDYVYDHAAEFPFSMREGRRLLFSEVGLERYLRQKIEK